MRDGEPYYANERFRAHPFVNEVTAQRTAHQADKWMCMKKGTHKVILHASDNPE